MELVLETLAIPPKEDPKDKAHEPTTTAYTQLPKDEKEKLVIKMKKIDCLSFFFGKKLAFFVLDLP